MEPPIRRSLDDPPRLRRLAIVLVLGALVVGLLTPIAVRAGPLINASMYVSRSEAEPGDLVIFWISIDPQKEIRKIVISDVLPVGLGVASTAAPASCEREDLTWTCNGMGRRAFVIEIRMIVEEGTEGQHLVNVAQIDVRGADEEDDEDRREERTVQAGVFVVPATNSERADLQVWVGAAQETIVLGSEVNYRIQVSNNGNASASNVSLIAYTPMAMILLSASPLPVSEDGVITWKLESLAPGSRDFLFNTTLPPTEGLTQVRVDVAITYTDGQGGHVRVEGLPSSLDIGPGAPSGIPIPVGLILVVLMSVGGCLFVAHRVVGPLGPSGAEEIFLLHRSGLVLEHFSAHPSTERDSDIVGGMMAAVRMFVEDSVNPGAGPLRQIRFSEGNVVFITGQNVTLAAVNPHGGAWFEDRARKFLQEFERTNDAALTNFDGVAGGLEGIDAMFRKFGKAPGDATSPPAGPE